MHYADIPRAEYEKFAPQFNPVKFNAAEWVAIAKNAGMKYIVITSKHHDGFSMFDSKVSDYTAVKSTPYKKDPLKELSRECKKAGIKFCVYHSIMDWHHPAQMKSAKGEYNSSRMAADRKDEYVKYMKGQLRELIENYDPAVLWFDGEWCDWWTEPDAQDLVQYLQALKPDVIINNRVGKGRKGMEGFNKGEGFSGDFFTPEQQIPATGLPGADWESCMTMNETWGFHRHDENWKSPTVLIQNLVDIASKGGNFLLNVGPKADGTIPEASVERLSAMGKWMKTNSESIYGTTASPFAKLAWGRATQKPGKIYLHVFNWPKGQLEVPADASRTRLEVAPSTGKLSIRLPAKAPDPIDSVVVLEIEGAPEIEGQASAR
jgi:alpha-L-fucosidase